MPGSTWDVHLKGCTRNFRLALGCWLYDIRCVAYKSTACKLCQSGRDTAEGAPHHQVHGAYENGMQALPVQEIHCRRVGGTYTIRCEAYRRT